MHTIDIDEVMLVLMPTVDKDEYDNDIKQAFITLLSLAPNSFVGLDLPYQTPQALPNNLEQIFASYKGCLTHPNYKFRASIASLYDVEPLDVSSVSSEWCWVAKLCHLLVYFAVINPNTDRVHDICTTIRLWHKPEHGQHEFWYLCHQNLQQVTLQDTYHATQDYLQSLINNKTHKTAINQFRIICRIIEFAHHERHRINRTVGTGLKRKTSLLKPRVQTTEIADDADDVLVEYGCFEAAAHDIDINREKLDNNPIDFMLIRQDSLRTHERYSAGQMARRTQAKFNHASQNEMLLSTSLRYLSIHSIQALTELLWRCFNNPKLIQLDYSAEVIRKSLALLLLSLYTGRKITDINTDFKAKSHNIIEYRNVGKICRLIVHLDITPRRLRDVHKVIANQTTSMYLPLPATLVATLALPYDSDCVDDIIQLAKQVLNMPVLSRARVETALYTFMSRNICSSQIASIITGRSTHKRADLWYCSHSEQEILTHYSHAIHKITAQLSTNTQHTATAHLNNSTITDSDYIGSQNCPSDMLATKFLQHLRLMVLHAKPLQDKFNAYSIWLWHIFLLLTSIRAVNDAPGLLKQLNLDNGIAWISDKEGRHSSSSQRLVPLCAFLVQAVNDYLAYLKQCKQLYAKLDKRIGININQIFNSERPLLNLMDEQFKLHPLGAGVIRQHIGQNFCFKEDWTRHLGQKYLHEYGADESLILSVFGHEMSGQESWHKHSSMSIGDIMCLKIHYQRLAEHLQLEQIV